MTPDKIELIALIVGQCLTAGAIYGAIRSDLNATRRDIDRHEHAIDRLHDRIDNMKGQTP